jgi:hypothetical protein
VLLIEILVKRIDLKTHSKNVHVKGLFVSASTLYAILQLQIAIVNAPFPFSIFVAEPPKEAKQSNAGFIVENLTNVIRPVHFAWRFHFLTTVFKILNIALIFIFNSVTRLILRQSQV